MDSNAHTDPDSDNTALKRSTDEKNEIKYQSVPPSIEEYPDSNLKYLILTLVSVLVGATYFLSFLFNRVISCEQLLPLQKDITEQLNITHTQYTALLAAYSFPNIFIPIFGGWFFDNIGRRYFL